MAELEKVTVLVADDEPDILELASFFLERSGYRVIQARDGESALVQIREQMPDVALLDVMMPKMDGFTLTRRLRAEKATLKLPIVLLTARVQEIDIATGTKAGANVYVTKPFSEQDLLKALDKALATIR